MIQELRDERVINHWGDAAGISVDAASSVLRSLLKQYFITPSSTVKKGGEARVDPQRKVEYE